MSSASNDVPRLRLQIVTPEGLFLGRAVEMVEMPTVSGEIGVLPGHVPMVTEISAGELRVHNSGEPERYALAGGFAQIKPDAVHILAAFAMGAPEEAQVEMACERARSALESSAELSPEIISTEIALLKVELAHLARHRKSSRQSQT